MITGGLGGLGLTVARSFVARGAKHLVLLGRSAPSERARAAIAEMTGVGTEVRIAAVDVADRPGLQGLFESIATTMPPLRGIVHAAGVLDDGVLLQQSWNRFERVLRPKVEGTWNLHELSAKLPLQFFVMFSSAAALFGAPGQSNYSAANAFLDALAHYRRARGLAAVSIAWGGWGESGMAASLEALQRASRQGVAMMEPGAALAVLHVLLRKSPPHIGVLDVNWSKLLSNYAQGQTPSVLDLLAEPTQAPAAAVVPLPERLRSAQPGSEPEIVVAYVRECLGAVLGMRTEEVDVDVPLLQLGLDSLMAVEARNRIESSGGPAVPLAKYLDGSDVRGIAAAICASLPAASPSDASAAIDADALVASMSDAEVEEMLARLRSEAQS
jgi:NAD(P)-dependent dehydrogenase (short-subunit alcohol dehydrogenase family)